DPDRNRKVRGRVQRSGGVHGTPGPGGPAGAGRVGRLPLSVPPLRPRLPDRSNGRSTCDDGPRRGIRRGAPVRVRGGRDGAAAVVRDTDDRAGHGGASGAAGGARRRRFRRTRAAAGGTAPSRTAGRPPASLRAVSGSLRSVTSNACTQSHGMPYWFAFQLLR